MVIKVQRLTPSLKQDYLDFFDHDAFVDNPHWQSCYCHFNHAPHDEKDWKERNADENRAAISDRIARGLMSGYLAYADGKPVGWCNASARSTITTLDGSPLITSAEKTGCIVCFIIAKPFRRLGIARLLLDAACEGFRQDRFEVIEAYPREVEGNDAENHHGRLSMFLDAGFERIDARYGFALVRKKI